MATIKIGNIKNLNREPNVVYIRIDRSSTLGNPFQLSKEGWRGYVIKAYREWLEGVLFNNTTDLSPFLTGNKWRGLSLAPRYKSPSPQEVYKEFNRILKYYLEGKDIYLLCWCDPLPCHAQPIKELIEVIASTISEVQGLE